MLLHLLEKAIDGYFAFIPRNKPDPALLPAVQLIAHRGAHDAAQGLIENTLSAFAQAKELGCWGIELDVHCCADKILVVHHDANLQRLWGHHEEIAQLTFQQLRALVPEIPTLAEVVATYGKNMHLFIELKTILEDEAILSQTLSGLNAVEDYHVLTMDAAFFSPLTQCPPELLLLVAAHNNIQKFGNLCLQENYGGVLGHYLLLNNKMIQRLKKGKKVTGVGLVNSRYSLYREINRQLSWIFTDNAAAISNTLQALHQDSAI